MKHPHRIELSPDTDEGGYVVSFPELSGCLTVGDTVEEAQSNAMEAKREWLEAAAAEGIYVKEPKIHEEHPCQ